MPRMNALSRSAPAKGLTEPDIAPEPVIPNGIAVLAARLPVHPPRMRTATKASEGTRRRTAKSVLHSVQRRSVYSPGSPRRVTPEVSRETHLRWRWRLSPRSPRGTDEERDAAQSSAVLGQPGTSATGLATPRSAPFEI